MKEEKIYSSVQRGSGNAWKLNVGLSIAAVAGLVVLGFNGNDQPNEMLAPTFDISPMFASPAVSSVVVGPRLHFSAAGAGSSSRLASVSSKPATYIPRSVPMSSVSHPSILLEVDPAGVDQNTLPLHIETEVEEEASAVVFDSRAASLWAAFGAVSWIVSKVLPSGKNKVAMLATAGTVDAEASPSASSMASTLKLIALLSLWYAFNISYNISAKTGLNIANLPWMQSCISMWMGVPIVLALWGTGIRKTPKLTKSEVLTMVPIAAMHALSNVGAIVSASFGALSFTQIVKSGEPVFTAGLSGLFLGQVYHPAVYAALVPIIGGVALASFGELSFSFFALLAAMVSNVSSALRSILSKKLMKGRKFGENMNSANVFGVMTILSAIIVTPFALYLEGPKIAPTIAAAVAAGSTEFAIIKTAMVAGLSFYLYNELAFETLNQVNAVTHAVANTVKRVVVILSSVIVFGTPLTQKGLVGSAIAIFGVMMYSLMRNKYPGSDYGQKSKAIVEFDSASEPLSSTDSNGNGTSTRPRSPETA